MNPIKKSTLSAEQKLKKRREQKRLSMQRAREKIKNNESLNEAAKLKERERWHERRKRGTVKVIEDLSDREKRRMRKQWRERYKRSVENKKQQKKEIANVNTPPPSPCDDHDIELVQNEILPKPSTSRIDSGKKIAKRNRKIVSEKLKKAEEKVKHLEHRADRYRKKYERLLQKTQMKTPSEDDTPRKTMAPILKNKNLDESTKKKLFNNEVICHQIKKTFQQEKSRNLKNKWSLMLAGTVIQKYRCMKHVQHLTSSQRIISKKIKKHKSVITKAEIVKKAVVNFFEEDKCSRLCPGKKDTITKKKEKRQKRLLNDSMKNLYKLFRTENKLAFAISYSTFCRYRPFWVIIPRASSRETCLCKIHENFSFIVKKLKSLKLIEENNASIVVENLCCKGKLKESCLERKCRVCYGKQIKILQCDDLSEPVKYEKWVTKKVPIIVRKEEKLSLRTVKVEVNCTKQDLINIFQNSLPKFMEHVSNIYHQYSTVDAIKKNLKHNEVLLHMDFSENYVCKYGQEIQSVHFGGSKQQVTLHTSVMYYHDPLNGDQTHKSFVTLSNNNRHDPAAIVAHLEPVINCMKQLIPLLDTVHFLSDGPSTQYRNKSMFHMFGSTLGSLLNVNRMAWHYSEASHGKGAPDGIGGAVKRTADAIVAKGEDIPDFLTLVNKLKEADSLIEIIPIKEGRILDFDQCIPHDVVTFKGTTKIHEITWVKGKDSMQARRLSCIICPFDVTCCHYELGEIPLLNMRQKPSNSLKIAEGNSDTEEDDWKLVKPPIRHKSIYKQVYSSSSDGEEAEKTTSNPNFDSNPIPTPKMNDFVVVKCLGKKSIQHFVAVIDEIINDEECRVFFLKRSGTTKFSLPEEEKKQLFDINIEDICAILNQPTHFHRNTYTFDFDFMPYNMMY